MRGALRSVKNWKTALKNTQNRKLHAKPSKPKIYTVKREWHRQLNFHKTRPSLDLNRGWYVEHAD